MRRRREFLGWATGSLLALFGGGCGEDRVPVLQEGGDGARAPAAPDEERNASPPPAYLRPVTAGGRTPRDSIGGLAGRRVSLRLEGSERRIDVLADAARHAGVSLRVEDDARRVLEAPIDGPCHEDGVAIAVVVEWCLPDVPPMAWEEVSGAIVVGRMKTPPIVEAKVYDLDDVVPLPLVGLELRAGGLSRGAGDWPPEAAQALARLVRGGVGRPGTWDLPGVALEPVGSSRLLVKHGRVVLAQVDDFLARFRRYVEGRVGMRAAPAGTSLRR